jgi:hypothetical protein
MFGAKLPLVGGKGLPRAVDGGTLMWVPILGQATFDPSSVYSGLADAFVAALSVAAALTGAIVAYRWVKRAIGR